MKGALVLEVTQTNIKINQTIISDGGKSSSLLKEDPQVKSFDQILAMFQLLGQSPESEGQSQETTEESPSKILEIFQSDLADINKEELSQLESILAAFLVSLQQKPITSVDPSTSSEWDVPPISNMLEKIQQQITADPIALINNLHKIDEFIQVSNIDQSQLSQHLAKILSELEILGKTIKIPSENFDNKILIDETNLELKQPLSLDKNQVIFSKIVNKRIPSAEEVKSFKELPTVKEHEPIKYNEQPIVTFQTLQTSEGSSMQKATPVALQVSEFAPEMGEWMGRFMRITKGESGSTEAKFSLFPEHLGHVEIKITSLQGQLSAQIITDTLLAKEALEGQLQHLKQALQQQGLVIQKLDVIQQSQGTINPNYPNSTLFNGNPGSSHEQRHSSEGKGSSKNKIEEDLKELDHERLSFTYGGQLTKIASNIDFTA
jgi:flagellar hook-length control protein FliK